jgi:hypothetical protein
MFLRSLVSDGNNLPRHLTILESGRLAFVRIHADRFLAELLSCDPDGSATRIEYSAPDRESVLSWLYAALLAGKL